MKYIWSIYVLHVPYISHIYFIYYSNMCHIPCELRAPEDFLERRYNLLDMSAMRVAYYGLDSWLFSQ